VAEQKQRKEPRVGSKFQRLYKGSFFTLEVVKNKGHIGYKLKGTTYPSPSAAAKAVTNNSVNGWVFWGMGKETTKSRG